MLGAKEQLARLIQSVIGSSALPAPLKAQLVAKLQALLAAFDPGNPAQRRAVCAALTAFGKTVQVLSVCDPARAGSAVDRRRQPDPPARSWAAEHMTCTRGAAVAAALRDAWS